MLDTISNRVNQTLGGAVLVSFVLLLFLATTRTEEMLKLLRTLFAWYTGDSVG